ncbi:hypothetical protein GV827_05060 [Sulfitobacter sp. JBTF-M27]|uniref:Uncharacterized protein n=1 Tax=Sulfitobacter sediminilitoris TaxID=2698830 RepID=A0A6P0C6I4_9RHOB|nr:hypothetical protein [Sulfitobacter sediminilitoris]
MFIIAVFCLSTLAHSYHLAGRWLHNVFGLLLVLLFGVAGLVRGGLGRDLGPDRNRSE